MNMLKYFPILFAAVLGLLPSLQADVPTVKAVEVSARAVKVDGVLSEAVWKDAPVYSNFTILNAQTKKAAEQTFFQVAASPEGFYWAFRCQDKSLKGKETLRDGAIWNDDSLEIFMTADDPLPEDPNVRRGRHFLFNILGRQYDATFLAGVSSSKWDSNWKVAVKTGGDGFTAEVFIPYYAFELEQAKKYWRFNVGRENYNGKDIAISVWSPANAFLQMERFAVLEVPAIDYRRYMSRFANLELKTVPVSDGISQILSGRIISKNSGVITLQAVARQEGKIKAINRNDLKLDNSGTTEFSIPLHVGKSGVYDVELSGWDAQGKIFYTKTALAMQAVPFTLKLTNPVYRKSIFADQKDKTIRLSVKYDAAEDLLKNAQCVLTVTDKNGKVIADMKKPAARLVDFAVDAAKWLPGRYEFCVKSSGTAALEGQLSETVNIIPPPEAGNTVYLGREREVILNGKPFFPRGFLGGAYEEERFVFLEKGGYNTFHFYTLNRFPIEKIHQVLDMAQRHGLKVIMYPYHETGCGFFGFVENNRRDQPRMSEAAWQRLRKMVEDVRRHPAFFGWYLCDEPRGAEFCAELRKVYRTLREIDPHHPVIGLDCSADGCISKSEGYCDINILDLYPHPMTDGSFMRPMAAVLNSMKMVHENIGSAGAWFCPQAFTQLDPKYRAIKYREIRALVYGAIVNGATAIIPYKIGNPSYQYYTANTNTGIFYSPETRLGYLEGIGPELKSLEDVLVAPGRFEVKSNDKELLLMHKKYQGKSFVFAVNPIGKALTVTIELPGVDGDKLRVLNENRLVKLNGGTFTDDFAPYAVHIYTDSTTIKDVINVAELENKIRLIDQQLKK